ncbi:MAG: DNA primase, partial [Candidatus Omnitrophica bacterium]|nr:DNA primase [Candidatus Omnitrophota bacterium]
MGLIPNDVINKVIESSDIVEIIGNYTTLKKAGRNFKALCPFHNEKTPSFVVNPDKQIFHCFGCGVGGNAVGFLMRQEHMEFPEAVRFLANKLGIVVPENESNGPHPSRTIREEVFKVNALAAGFFHEMLLTSREADAQAARDYLKGRGVNLETVKKFQLGFAPNEWDALLKYLRSKGISEELVSKAGLIIAREEKRGFYDRFRNRIVFPILDIQGRSVAFGARAMQESDGAKYVNSPETAVYTKGRHMYGLQLTKAAVGKLDQVIVVEGYMDMIMPCIHGVENIVASLGTALTVEQIRLIRRYTPNVVMLFDTDAAGQSAIVRSLDLLIDEGMNVRVATLAQDEDPDSFIRQQGLEAFTKRIESASSLLDFKFNWLAGQYDPKTVEGKSKVAQELLGTIARFKNEVAKYELTKALAKMLDIPEGVLLKQGSRGGFQTRPYGGVETRPSNGPSQMPAAEIKVSALPKAGSTAASAGQELLLALFLKDPAWVKAARKNIGPEDFSDGLTRLVVGVIWSLTDEKNEWSTNDLLVRLNDEQAQSLVTRLISIEEGKLGDAALVFQDCIGKIKKEKQKKARGRLLEAIHQAEA